MDHQDATSMMRSMHRKHLWGQWVSMFLGAWLIATPWTLGYQSTAIIWSDTITGILVVVFSILSLWPERAWSRWANCFAGLWLLVAPLLFWAPQPAALNNDWIVGALLITFSVLYPMMPGMAHHRVMMKPGPEIPPGWTYNPSTWLQRGPIIALSLVAFLMARYMAGHQLGYYEGVWDPFFGAGTFHVLNSDVSKAWPISDAGLGAAAYLIEALSGFMGGQQRWRTMPWMVLMFFVLVVPLGITSIILVMLQPISVGAWCTLCLATALLMLLMIPLALDEVVAMFQFLALAKREGQSLWRVFWIGGTLQAVNEDHRTPDVSSPTPATLPPMVWGVGLPWAHVTIALLGMALLFLPDLTAMTGAARANVYLSATIIIVTAVVAWAEVARPMRFLNLPLGLWLAVSPLALTGGTWFGDTVLAVAGLTIAALSLPRGRVRETYGNWSSVAEWTIHRLAHGRIARSHRRSHR